jgi:hypothetical protein
MKINLSKDELKILNKALGFLIDYESSGSAPDSVSELIESDEFNELNEKIAEKFEDAEEL